MSDIPLSQLTNITPTDTGGVFDALMQAVEKRLEQEFDKGRIKGTDYSKVYLSLRDCYATVSGFCS